MFFFFSPDRQLHVVCKAFKISAAHPLHKDMKTYFRKKQRPQTGKNQKGCISLLYVFHGSFSVLGFGELLGTSSQVTLLHQRAEKLERLSSHDFSAGKKPRMILTSRYIFTFESPIRQKSAGRVLRLAASLRHLEAICRNTESWLHSPWQGVSQTWVGVCACFQKIIVPVKLLTEQERAL